VDRPVCCGSPENVYVIPRPPKLLITLEAEFYKALPLALLILDLEKLLESLPTKEFLVFATLFPW
jgi:hypothetical protein